MFSFWKHMKYSLPVIQTQAQPLIPSDRYTQIMADLEYILYSEPVCDIDNTWRCFMARKKERSGRTCCDIWYQPCTHLSLQWCTTKNILCKTFYCPDAFKRLHTKTQNTIRTIQVLLHTTYWKVNDYNTGNLFYKSEAQIKQLLGIDVYKTS